jgi:hypothetical protein
VYTFLTLFLHSPLSFHFFIFISPCIFSIFPKCNQQDATFLNIFISIKRSTCFRRFLRPSSGAQTVHTASGICQTLLLPVAIMVVRELVWMQWVHPDQFHHTDDSSKVWQIPEAMCTVWAPDDGRRNRLKHVEHFIEINILRNVASCWLHFGNFLSLFVDVFNYTLLTAFIVWYSRHCLQYVITLLTSWKFMGYNLI